MTRWSLGLTLWWQLYNRLNRWHQFLVDWFGSTFHESYFSTASTAVPWFLYQVLAESSPSTKNPLLSVYAHDKISAFFSISKMWGLVLPLNFDNSSNTRLNLLTFLLYMPNVSEPYNLMHTLYFELLIVRVLCQLVRRILTSPYFLLAAAVLALTALSAPPSDLSMLLKEKKPTQNPT